MELITGCLVKVSVKSCVILGERQRIVDVDGSKASLADGVGLLMQRIYFSLGKDDKLLTMRFVVPGSAVGPLIDRAAQGHGDFEKCQLTVNSRIKCSQEWVVSLSGEYGLVVKAVARIMNDVMRDSHLSGRAHPDREPVLRPAGRGRRAASSEPPEPALPPERVRAFTKRDLGAYLQRAATPEIMMRYGLFGSLRRIVKGRSRDELIAAVSDVWSLRGGRLQEACAELPPPSRLSGDGEVPVHWPPEGEEGRPEVVGLPLLRLWGTEGDDVRDRTVSACPLHMLEEEEGLEVIRLQGSSEPEERAAAVPCSHVRGPTIRMYYFRDGDSAGEEGRFAECKYLDAAAREVMDSCHGSGASVPCVRLYRGGQPNPGYRNLARGIRQDKLDDASGYTSSLANFLRPRARTLMFTVVTELLSCGGDRNVHDS